MLRFLPPAARPRAGALPRVAVALVALAFAVRPAAAQPPGPPPDGAVDAATRRAAVDSALGRLGRGYVDPAAGNAPAGVADTARGPGLVEQSWTLPVVPGRRYVGRPVYVLTSRHTASGAEEFSYVLQTRGRATVVGDTTRGAANPGGTERVTPQFTLFVPRGRAVNPVTGRSWEGVGVAPDVALPADHALTQAYVLALKAVQRRGGYAGPEPLSALVAGAERDLAAARAGR